MATKKQATGKTGKTAEKAVAKKTAAAQAPKKEAKSAPVKIAAPAKPVAKAPAKKATAAKATDTKKSVAPAKNVAALAKPIIKPAPKAVEKKVKAAPAPMPRKEEAKKPAAKAAKEAPAKPSMADIKAKDIKVPAPKPVNLPKINTKTARKYEPDFTKSVLDSSTPEPQGPSLRYSDNELVEFKELIMRKLESAKKELHYLQGLITRKDDMGGDEGDNRYMTMEDGSLSMEREQLSQMASRQITFIDHLEKALMRIENKTYGICRVTGKLIDKARLRAVPHATLSIEAKMGNVR
jgi:RNA polymerase-binding transcription factor DksA